MELLFLGTSAGTPTRERNVTSLALRLDHGRVWLVDCGEATQHRILASSLKPNDIDLLLLTHLHGDHCYGLFGLVSSLAVHGRGTKPFTIVGPRGCKRLLETVFKLSYAHMPFPLIFHEIDDEGMDLDFEGWLIQARPLTHRTPCFGYYFVEPDGPGRLDAARCAALGIPSGPDRGRLVRGQSITLASGAIINPAQVVGPPRPGRRIVVLGDTSDSSSLHDVAHGCDVLVHEATFTADLKDKAIQWGHSTTAMAGDCAAAMAARHLILTHFSSRYPGHGAEWEALKTQFISEARTHCPATTVHIAEDLHSAQLALREAHDDSCLLRWQPLAENAANPKAPKEAQHGPLATP